MTTEDDFQRALDACPDDWQTRLVFADWLQEHADDPCSHCHGSGDLYHDGVEHDPAWYCPQCDGNGKAHPDFHARSEGYRALAVNRCCPKEYQGRWCWIPGHMRGTVGDCWLPCDWTNQIPDSNYRNTRSRAEDAAAHAFAKLPGDRRAELLRVGGTTNET